MLYLGRDEAGTPMAIHAFSEYVEPCEADGASEDDETLRRVDLVTVSDLSLGRVSDGNISNTNRTAAPPHGRGSP